MDWFKRKSRGNHGKVASRFVGTCCISFYSRMSYASYASQVSEASPCVERPNFRVKPMQQHRAFFSASCLQFAHAPILLIDCFLAWLNSHFFSLKRSNCLAYTCSASLVTSSYLCFSFSLKPSWFSRFILVKWDGSKLLHPKYPQIKTENKQCRQSIVGQLASYPTRTIPDMLRMLAIPLLYVAIVGWSQ